MPKTPKQSSWQRVIAKYRKDHPNTPNLLVYKRASKLYRAKTPSRSMKRTPARRTPARRTPARRTPSKVCARYSTGKSPRRCKAFRKTPVRHCSKFSTPKGKKARKCIRYSRTPLRR